VNVLLYLAVAATLISGADYFLGLRKRLAEAHSGADGPKTGHVGPFS
jgi:hypothetical protein